MDQAEVLQVMKAHFEGGTYEPAELEGFADKKATELLTESIDVVEALAATEADWKEEPRWAIHPAGITLLVRISRKLGIPGAAIQPSIDHYREHSNMSSASIVHILNEVAAETPVGAAINLLTMGAGFNVLYGRVRRVS